MRTVPLLAVIFFGSFFAQPALSESIISRDVSRSSLNRADCEATNTVGVSWSIATSTASLSYTIRLEARDHSSASNPCPIGMGSSNVETLETLDVTNLNTQVDVTFNIDTNDIFEDGACGETGARETKTFCLYVRDQTNIDVASDGFTIAYDTVLPTELEVKSIQPGDEKIQFQVSGGDPNGDKILSYVVSYRSCDSEASSNLTASDAGVMSADGGTPPDDAGLLAPGPHADAGPRVTDAGTTDPTPAEDDAGAAATALQNDGGIAESFPRTDGRDGGSTSESLCDAKGDFLTMTSSTSTVTINDLNNDEQYEFKVYAIDDFDNAGPTSELFTAVPLNEVSVMNMYDGNPNPWGFNCQQAGSAPSWILLLLFSLFFMKRTRGPRRRVPFNGSALVVLLALTAQPAHAEVGQTSFSMTGGPYKPAIDAEEVDGKPIFPIYDCFFDDETLTLLQLDFGYRAADGYGNLQLGLGLGYAQARGTAQTADILTTGRCGEQSSGSVALHLMELRPYVGYYLDSMFLHWGIPLVPYLKLGVASFLYGWTHDGELDRSGESDGNTATGFRPAIDTSAGVVLSLDWLEPGVTQRAKASGAYENAYALVEVAYVSTVEPGLPGFNFSATDLYFDSGQPLMLRFGIMVEYP